MVLEIFLVRVTCEALLETSGRQVLRLGREKLVRLPCRHGSERRPVKAHSCLEGAQPGAGPSEGVGSEKALAEGLVHRSSLPVALSLPEILTTPQSLLTGPCVPSDPQCHTSTCSDSEEFLTCYSGLVLHQAALFSKDIALEQPEKKPPPGSSAGLQPTFR